MAISKERTVYISVLSLGLAALAGDRLFGGPAEASAADPSALLMQSDLPRATTRPSSPAGFPQRLRAKAGELPEERGSDAFLIPTAWLPQKQPAALAAPEAEIAGEQTEDLAAFFTLSSVYAASGRNASDHGAAGRGYVSAVINKTLLEKGSAFDLRGERAVRAGPGSTGAFVLEEIDSGHVTIRIVGDNSLVQVHLKSEVPGNARIETRARPDSPDRTAR